MFLRIPHTHICQTLRAAALAPWRVCLSGIALAIDHVGRWVVGRALRW